MSYELHVLQGLQRGARAQVPSDRAVSISSQLGSDIVLRDADVADRSATFTVHDDHWVVHALHGELQADGQLIAAGQTAKLPLGAALSIGATQIAVQRMDSANASAPPDHAADEAPTADHEADAPSPTDALPLTPPAQRNQHLQRWGKRLTVAGGGMAAVCVGVLAFAYSIQPAPVTASQQAQQLQSKLHGLGLTGLNVRPADVQGSQDQTLLVQGYVASAADRAKGEALMQQATLPTQWKAWVSEQASNQVQNVFRTHGVEAKVQTLATGAVLVNTAVADPSVLEQVRAAAQRDVPGLTKLEVANTAPPPDTRGAPVNDPGKRVALIVPGDPPHVVTADGTRYFQGAMLPTGHRIAAIEKQKVLLEINGVLTPLLF
jgi:type III secretion protein D